MDGRAWRLTGLQLAIVGLEAVWIALMALVLSPARAADARLLFVTGVVTLLWNRWLLSRAWWERGWGRAIGLAGMALILAGAGVLAEPAVVLRAVEATRYADRVALLLGSKPLLVAWLASAIMMARVLLLLRRQLTFDRAIGRIRTCAVITLASLALLHGETRGLTALLAGLVGFALIVTPLARAIELTRARAQGGMPFTARWVGTLLLGVAAVLLLGIGADSPLDPRHFGLIAAVVAMVQTALVHLFAVLIELFVRGLLPVVHWFIDLYSGIIRDVILPWLEALIAGRAGNADAARIDPRLLQALAVALVLVTVLLPVFVIWHLYRLFKIGAHVAEAPVETEEAALAAAWFEWWQARRDEWLRRLSRWRRRYSVDTVRDLYKNLLLFGDAHALSRPAANTPYEYLEPLCRRYPALDGEFHALTDAYVAVKYGEHDFSDAEVRGLQNAWDRIASYKDDRAGPPDTARNSPVPFFRPDP